MDIKIFYDLAGGPSRQSELRREHNFVYDRNYLLNVNSEALAHCPGRAMDARAKRTKEERGILRLLLCAPSTQTTLKEYQPECTYPGERVKEKVRKEMRVIARDSGEIQGKKTQASK